MYPTQDGTVKVFEDHVVGRGWGHLDTVYFLKRAMRSAILDDTIGGSVGSGVEDCAVTTGSVATGCDWTGSDTDATGSVYGTDGVGVGVGEGVVTTEAPATFS